MPPDRDRNDMHFATYLGASRIWRLPWRPARLPRVQRLAMSDPDRQHEAAAYEPRPSNTLIRPTHLQVPMRHSTLSSAGGMLSDAGRLGPLRHPRRARALGLGRSAIAHPPPWFGPSTLALKWIVRAIERRSINAWPTPHRCATAEATELPSHAMAVGGCDTEIRNLDLTSAALV